MLLLASAPVAPPVAGAAADLLFSLTMPEASSSTTEVGCGGRPRTLGVGASGASGAGGGGGAGAREGTVGGFKTAAGTGGGAGAGALLGGAGAGSGSTEAVRGGGAGAAASAGSSSPSTSSHSPSVSSSSPPPPLPRPHLPSPDQPTRRGLLAGIRGQVRPRGRCLGRNPLHQSARECPTTTHPHPLVQSKYSRFLQRKVRRRQWTPACGTVPSGAEHPVSVRGPAARGCGPRTEQLRKKTTK